MISNDSLIRAFAPGSLIKPQEDLPGSGTRDYSNELSPSFFHGLTVGIVLAVPVWALVIVSSIR
jgi:hypothetical protein